MNFATLTGSIRADFKTRVEDGLNYPTQYENITITKAEDISWVRLSIFPLKSKQASRGSSAIYRTPGIMIVQVFVPVAKGDGPAYVIADAIADLYRSTTVSGVRFQTPGVVKVGVFESWWQLNVECPFYYDVRNV